MKPTKGLWLHLGLLVAAGVVAYASASAKHEPAEGKRVEAEIWPGPAEAVKLVTYESDERRVVVTPAKDSVGVYAVVEATKQPPKSSLPDAGVSAAPTGPETKRFIAVDEAQKLVSALAPAKSYRSLGKLDPGHLGDYGLDKPEAKLSIQLGDKTYRMEVGALTPGSGDYYVRDPATGLVHTFSADILGKLKFGESRLLEHDLHGFAADDVRSVVISANGKQRKVVRYEGKADAWADAASPTVVDETAGNWLLKVQRLHPASYVEKPTAIGATPALRVEYFDKKGKAGFFELYRRTDQEKKYLGRSERSRWYVEVPTSAAEPIEQDLPSVVK
jgi:hypothetical protein